MHDGDAHPGQAHVRPLGHQGAQFVAVVVAPARHEPRRSRLQGLESGEIDPVAGVDHHVGAVDLVPHPGGQVSCPLRDMGVGQQQ